MVSGTNMVKIIVCIFTILFYSQKKQSLWYERHFLGMNDIVITFLYNFFPIIIYLCNCRGLPLSRYSNSFQAFS